MSSSTSDNQSLFIQQRDEYILHAFYNSYLFSLHAFDVQSFIGKMKVGVSKILPNSLSKWLSPKVDANNARRRRHDEIDSDDDPANRTSSPLASGSNVRYQSTPESTAPPPNKKKKTFTVSI